MKRAILNVVVAGSIALAGGAFAQTGTQAQNNGASAPTPYEGPSSYGTAAGANQQSTQPGLHSNIGSNASAQCANIPANTGPWQSCMNQQNDAIWNPGGVQDDHGQ